MQREHLTVCAMFTLTFTSVQLIQTTGSVSWCVALIWIFVQHTDKKVIIV